jgi:hypothetical protein
MGTITLSITAMELLRAVVNHQFKRSAAEWVWMMDECVIALPAETANELINEYLVHDFVYKVESRGNTVVLLKELCISEKGRRFLTDHNMMPEIQYESPLRGKSQLTDPEVQNGLKQIAKSLKPDLRKFMMNGGNGGR